MKKLITEELDRIGFYEFDYSKLDDIAAKFAEFAKTYTEGSEHGIYYRAPGKNRFEKIFKRFTFTNIRVVKRRDGDYGGGDEYLSIEGDREPLQEEIDELKKIEEKNRLNRLESLKAELKRLEKEDKP